MKKAFSAVLPILGSLLLSAELWSQAQPIPLGFQNGQAARLVLGQTNFSDISFATNQARLGAISGITLAGNKLIVADSSYLAPPNNNRVLIYNDSAAFRGWEGGFLVPADVVVGQPDFSTSTPGTTASRMNQPVGVASDGTRLFVAEWGNNRILIFNRIPETNGAAADVVVGQDRFDSSEFGVGPQKLRRPNSVSTDGARLFIADTLNNRVLIYNRIPTQNGASADVVLGQPNFDSSRALPTASNTLSSPMSVTTDGQRLIISDLGNNRILIYNRIPTQSGASADGVVGQPDFTSNGAGNTPASVNFPRYAYSDGQRLLVVDSGNNRLLIYNQFPTANGAQPDAVLGQADFMGLLESCAASNFAVPYSAVSVGGMVFVSDSFNRRILGFRPGTGRITLDGIVNAASFSTAPQTQACGVVLPQPPLAPGAIASVFGANLADATIVAGSLPLPAELGGVRVKFNGAPAPLFFVSPTQINVQIPFDLTGYSASVEVEKTTPQGTIVSAAAPVALSTGAPGVFTVSGDGEGAGVIVHSDFSPVTPDSPARPGESLTAFATGLGTVDRRVANGAAADFAASGSVTVAGTLGAGQTLTIRINGRGHSYTTESGDTLDSIAQRLAEMIDANDPEVTATADTVDFKVNLLARVLGDAGTGISYNAFVSEGATLTLDTGVSNVVPNNIVIGGIPAPGQTVTVTLADVASASYTTQPGDTLETIVTNLAELLDGDPNITAIADPANFRILLQLRNPGQDLRITISLSVSDGATLTIGFEPPRLAPGVAKVNNTVTALIGDKTAAVSFAGLVRGTVGLYQVNFTVPSDAKTDPAATLVLHQNLIVFGSVTGTNIYSSPVTFPLSQ